MKTVPKYELLLLLVLIIPIGIYAQKLNQYSEKEDAGRIYHQLQEKLNFAKNRPENQNQIAIAYLNLGEYYHTFGLYTEAIAQYNFALKELGSNLENPLYITLNNNIGKVYLSLNNFNLAEQHFEETKQASERLGDDKELAISLGFLGASHEKQGEYKEALKDQRQSLELFQKLDDV